MTAAPPPLRALLFDVDGTMADSDPFHRAVYKEILAPFGIECDDEFFVNNISGRANRELRHTLTPHLSDTEADEWFANKELAFHRLCRESMSPLRGFLELVDWCHSHGIKVAAVTNAPKYTVEIMFEIFGLCNAGDRITPAGTKGPKGYLDTVVLGDECAKSKPAPDAYLLAMERLDVRADEVLVFEDSLSGARAGLAAGCRTIGVMTTKSAQEFLELGCYDVIDHYNDIDFDALVNTGKNFIRREHAASESN